MRIFDLKLENPLDDDSTNRYSKPFLLQALDHPLEVLPELLVHCERYTNAESFQS